MDVNRVGGVVNEDGCKSLERCDCGREIQSTRGLRIHHNWMGYVCQVCEKEVQQCSVF